MSRREKIFFKNLNGSKIVDQFISLYRLYFGATVYKDMKKSSTSQNESKVDCVASFFL